MLRWVSRAVAIFGVGIGVAVLLATQLWAPDDDKLMWMKWGSPPAFDEAFYNSTLAADHIILTPGVWEGNADRQKIMVGRNVKVEFGTYFSAHTCPPWMEDAAPGLYPRKLWEFLSKNLAVTTEGDTASIWKDFPVYDLFDPFVRRGAATILGEYCREAGIRTVFFDYFTVPLVRYDQPQPGVHGELDFNRNGVGHSEDIPEQIELKAVWFRFIEELRQELPSGTMIVANGRLAIVDPEFTAVVDAVHLEDFPQYFWGSVNANWVNALDPGYPNNLHELIGRGKEVVLGDRFNRQAVSALADSLEIYYGPVK